MSAERDDGRLDDPELARALAALPEVRADAAFEARLRERFLAGAPAADVPAADAPAPAPRRRRPTLLAPLALAAAAALVVVLFLTRADETPGWELVASRGDSVQVDDRTYSLDRPLELARALRTGDQVRTPEGTTLRLRMGAWLTLEVGAGSQVRLPGLRVAPFPPPTLSALSGHVAVATGPDFAGSRLVVRTPELEAEVVGTRFAVDVGENGTCVCCSEGTVQVRSLTRPDQAGPVEAGAMAQAMPDGSLKFAAMVVPEHVEGLSDLDADEH